MAQVTISINSREYAIACEDGQEARIISLSRTLDNMANALGASVGQVNENMLLVMLALMMADENYELKKSKTLSSEQPPVDNTTLCNLDEKLAEKLTSLNNQIKSVATKIKNI
jgi:cell division protein ZapA